MSTDTSEVIFKDVFISYGRKESLAFAAKFHQQIRLKGLDAWFDKVNIPSGDDYVQRIQAGIRNAHNFIFVMAPHSLTSQNCLEELAYANSLGKRIFPLNHIEETPKITSFYTDDQKRVRQEIADILGNRDWLMGREELGSLEELDTWKLTYENSWKNHELQEYLESWECPVQWNNIDKVEEVVEKFIEVRKSDKEYVEQHSKLLYQAIEWESHHKQTKYLLVGKERQEAEDWLLTEFNQLKLPPCKPTDLQCEYICEARKNAENLMTDVFICYDTDDIEIRNSVINSLSRNLITTWTHDGDIIKGAKWGEAIDAGIEQADNFLFFISPESLTSEYCYKEIQHAHKMNKRIVPLLVKETPIEKLQAYEAIEGLDKLQYVDFTDNTVQKDFDDDVDQILNLLRKEQAYFEQHKILLARAIQWEKEGKKNAYLLRGFNLENATTWLRLNEKRELYGPTDLHLNFVKTSQAAKGSLGTEIFISYSRKDGDFARKLNQRLQEAGKTTWFDQESISSGVDFEKEIFKGIDGADNIVFVISPDSIESEYCENEVLYAYEKGKRFITLLYRETNPETMPETLRVINWIDFSQEDEKLFDKRFSDLIQAVELDQEHTHQHTILQQRATEWNENKKAEDFLLNVTACENASHWLEDAGVSVPEIPLFAVEGAIVLDDKADLFDKLLTALQKLQKSKFFRNKYVTSLLGLVLWSLIFAVIPIDVSNSDFFGFFVLVSYILVLLTVQVGGAKWTNIEELTLPKKKKKGIFRKIGRSILKLILFTTIFFVFVYIVVVLTEDLYIDSLFVSNFSIIYIACYWFVIFFTWLFSIWANYIKKKRLKNKVVVAEDVPIIDQYVYKNKVKNPPPSKLQVGYIHESRFNIAIATAKEEITNRRLIGRLRISRIALAIGSILLVFSVVIGTIAYNQSEKAKIVLRKSGEIIEEVLGEMAYVGGGELPIKEDSLLKEYDYSYEMLYIESDIAQLKPYEMSKYEVTVAQWRNYVLSEGIKKYDTLSAELNEKAPILNIGFYDAIRYCNWLSMKDSIAPYYIFEEEQRDGNDFFQNFLSNNNGRLKLPDIEENKDYRIKVDSTSHGYRLPYSTEWEFAIMNDSTVSRGMAIVGSTKPNKHGLYDIKGNAYEWSWDNISTVGELVNEAYPGNNHKGMIYMHSAESNDFIRFVPKLSSYPLSNQYNTGFRIARSIIVVPEMVSVDGGTFYRSEDVQRDSIQVTLDNFEIGKYEVTVKDWSYYVKSEGLTMPEEPNWGWHNDDPIMAISWYEAIRYCNWLSTMNDLTPRYLLNGAILPTIDINQEYLVEQDTSANGYRLPTEAEWEFAARGGNKSEGYIYSGGEYQDYVAWNDKDRVHRKGTKSANELGIYDMSGNVFEWCWDNWSEYYPPVTEQLNPQGPLVGDEGTGRVLRGGSWYNEEDYLRVSKRAFSQPLSRFTNFGFRVARSK